MSFALEHFELHFSPNLVPVAEQLYDNKAIVHFQEIERNLWSFEVRDGDTFEIEVLITPSKVKSYTCDCENFVSESECKHVIASLYKLRLLKTKKVAISPKVATRFPKKLSIPNILGQIAPEDLVLFVRNYAKKNKQFATEIKANFARYIDLENNEDKYESILNGIIKPATGVSYKIGHQTIRQFKNVAHQFDAQFEDAISLKQYKEASYIIKALLSKNAYINHWTASENTDVTELNEHLHHQLDYLLSLKIAPDLREELLLYSINLVSRSYYHVTHSEQNLLLYLKDAVNDEERKIEMVKILNRAIKSQTLHEYELEHLWIIRQYFVNDDLQVAELRAPLLGSQAIYRVCERLYKQKAFNGLIDFFNKFSSNGYIKDRFLVKKYISTLFQLSDKKLAKKECLKYLYALKDLYFCEILKEQFPESIGDIFEEIKSQLESKRSVESENLYFRILKLEGNVNELVKKLTNGKGQLRHVYEFADFIEQNSDQLPSVSIKVIDRYLSEYLGRESSIEIRRFLIFLRTEDYERAFKAAKKHLSDNYSDRKSLKEEIRNL